GRGGQGAQSGPGTAVGTDADVRPAGEPAARGGTPAFTAGRSAVDGSRHRGVPPAGVGAVSSDRHDGRKPWAGAHRRHSQRYASSPTAGSPLNNGYRVSLEDGGRAGQSLRRTRLPMSSRPSVRSRRRTT